MNKWRYEFSSKITAFENARKDMKNYKFLRLMNTSIENGFINIRIFKESLYRVVKYWVSSVL